MQFAAGALNKESVVRGNTKSSEPPPLIGALIFSQTDWLSLPVWCSNHWDLVNACFYFISSCICNIFPCMHWVANLFYASVLTKQNVSDKLWKVMGLARQAFAKICRKPNILTDIETKSSVKSPSGRLSFVTTVWGPFYFVFPHQEN